MNSFDTFSIEPMSAGDIIDRAVRLYRRNFLVFVRIVLGPSIASYAGWILLEVGMRNFSLDRGDLRITFILVMVFFGGALFLTGKVAFYAVLGGASRSLVYHLFDGTPIRARDVYRTVREKLWPLVGAMCLIGLLIGGIGVVIIYVVLIISVIYGALIASVFSVLPVWLQTISNIIFGILLVVTVVVPLLTLYSRMVYVPQVLMVEGKKVYEALGRSSRLAKGELFRIAALVLFWVYVAWSIWLLLMMPLGWYGYWSGIDINPFGADEPLWYGIAQQTLTQLSEILIAPIVMLGFTLLYIDSKVRKEGFDVELLANRLLPPPPEIPQMRQTFSQQNTAQFETRSWVPSIFGLNEHGSTPINPTVSGTTSFESASNDFDRTGNEGDLFHKDLPAMEQQADKTVLSSPPVQEIASTVQLDTARRTCRWCGTEANVEDRFCRICGSVF